ncbi:MAG: transposase [Deltaproteobacteria bacterium]|nr:transposase [Deltaproteobacteria bacterium]
MARLARIVVPEIPHHIVQRGNRRQDVFFGDSDKNRYIEFIGKACEDHGVDIWSWCLMSNHVHFIAVPEREGSFAKCFSEAHVRYTRMINTREKWKGHLWQGRFSSSPLDENYLLAATRYVERNPVRARMVQLPWEFKYSSAAYRIGEKSADPLISNDQTLQDLIDDWRTYLYNGDSEEDLAKIRKEESGGRPIGSKSFIENLEKELSRSFNRKPVGRPSKKRN